MMSINTTDKVNVQVVKFFREPQGSFYFSYKSTPNECFASYGGNLLFLVKVDY